ncbi:MULTISPECIES: hypothetical protein [Streptomyces]|uniref:Integrase n=2 Tax=Streptomyces TaxID=1883 RepID=A0ABV9J703_9ACTN
MSNPTRAGRFADGGAAYGESPIEPPGRILQPPLVRQRPQPFGDLSQADMDLIGKLAGDLPDVRTETTRERRLLVVRMLLRHLDQFPGGTWQERWEASGLNDAKTPVRDRESTKERRAFITTGLKTVLALRLIQPSLEAFRSNKFMGYQGMFLPAQGDPLVDQFVAAVSRHEVSQVHRDHALFLKNLARTIAHTFWRKIEAINPGQHDLHIDQAVYGQWKAELRLRENGKPRTDAEHILLQVRSFYLDLHSWAVEEPERWAAWAAPCPISRGDLRGFGARRRRLQERTDDRTRQRQPLLPILVAHVETRFENAQGFLAIASSATPGASFIHKGRQYRRTVEGLSISLALPSFMCATPSPMS